MERTWTVLLIGGPVATGKTTVAEKLSLRYKIPFLEASDVLVAMQQVADHQKYSQLFTFAEKSSDFISDNSVTELLNEYEALCEIVWKGLKVVIENHLQNDQPIIIEGDALLPRLISEFPKDKVQGLFLYDAEKNLYDREIERSGAEGGDGWYKKYIAWQAEFGKQLVKEAKKHRYFAVKTSPINSFYSRILAAIEPRSWMRIE